MNICITINLEYKLRKVTELEIEKFILKKISVIKIESILEEIEANKFENLLIEDKCIDNVKKFKRLYNRLQERRIKIIILNFNEIKAINYKNVFNVNLIEKDYKKELIRVLNVKFKVNEKKKENYRRRRYENKSFEDKPRTRKYKQKGKDYNKKLEGNKKYNIVGKSREYSKCNKIDMKDEIHLGNNIIALGLDNKVYTTTSLITLGMYLTKKKIVNEVNYYEKEQSIIDVEKIINLNKNNINYKKFSIIKMYKSETDTINLIDFGKVDNIIRIKEIMNFNYLKVIVFTSDCLKVRENDQYISMLRYLEKCENVILLNRKDIFDRKVQEKINYYKSKVVIKALKKTI